MKRYDLIDMSLDKIIKLQKELEEEILSEYISKREECNVILKESELTVNKGLLLLNLYLLEPLIKNDIDIHSDDFFTSTTVTQKSLNKYFDKLLKKYTLNKEEYDSARLDIFEVLNKLSDISGKINSIAGNTVSYFDFLKTASESKEMKELFYHKSEFGKQFSEIESEWNDIGNKLMNYYRDNKESDLHPFVVSQTGINKKQLIQAVSMVGLKPDMDGNIIPVVIDTNYLRGFSDMEHYFINCKGTRLALNTNFNYVRSSGYLTRKLSLLNVDNYHDNSIYDCGTIHFIKFICSSKEKLDQITGRHYYMLNDKGEKVGELLTVSETDDHLIGKIIGLRSPETCSSDKVCATCYGRKLSKINSSLNTGLSSVLLITNVLTQQLLSAKHLLTTNSESIDWPIEVVDNFILDMECIYFNETEMTVNFKTPGVESYDEDIDEYFINDFELIVNKKKYDIISPVPLYINLDLVDMESETTSLSSNTSDQNKYLFKFSSINRAITKSLKQILDLLESTDHLGMTTMDDFINKFSDLLLDNNMGYIKLIHPQMISRNLILDKEGKRPDFTKDDIGEYSIYRVSQAILESSISKSLSFERLSEQLSNLKTYEKDDSSLMDSLFE